MFIIMRFPNGLKKTLTLSYDDGVSQDIRMCEILSKNSIKCTFNINGGLFAPEGSSARRLSLSAAVDLYNKHGQDVAAHGFEHQFLTYLNPSQFSYEMVKDREILEKAFDRTIRGLAYAYGAVDNKTVDTLRALGFVYARTTLSTESFSLPSEWLRLNPTAHHNNPRLMELAKRFAETDTGRHPAMFYLWGHTYEFDDNKNWNVIEEFCEYMGGREDIWYASNTEIYDYVEAYGRLVWNANSSVVYNPTVKTLWFDANGTTYSIAPDQTLKIR